MVEILSRKIPDGDDMPHRITPPGARILPGTASFSRIPLSGSV